MTRAAPRCFRSTGLAIRGVLPAWDAVTAQHPSYEWPMGTRWRGFAWPMGTHGPAHHRVHGYPWARGARTNAPVAAAVAATTAVPDAADQAGAGERASACSRSATRSSTDSIPTESRTRLFGGANGASAVEACVIRAG